MKTKLIALDIQTIKRAEEYASRTNQSLSKIIETYPESLTKAPSSKPRHHFTVDGGAAYRSSELNRDPNLNSYMPENS